MRNSWTLTLLAIAIATGQATAGDGRTPIWEPTVITESGAYVLTRDINTPSNWGPTILVQSGLESVDIDLNGFTLAGDPNLSMEAIIQATDAGHVTVRNGVFVGRSASDSAAIWVNNTRRVIVEDVTVLNSGGPGIVVENASVASVRRNSVHNAGSEAIKITGVSTDIPVTGQFDDNDAWYCDDGFQVHAGSGISMRNNRVAGTEDDGIRIHGCEACFIVDNSVRNAGQRNGITLHSPALGCEIRGNAVYGSASDGIMVEGDGHLIVGNVVRESGGDGLRIDGNQNHVERNVLMFNGLINGGFGLHFLSGNQNYYTRNTASGNLGGSLSCDTNAAAMEFCDDTGFNKSFGDNRMPNPN